MNNCFTPDDSCYLEQRGSWDDSYLHDFPLIDKIVAHFLDIESRRKNIIVSGESGSGKTILAQRLLARMRRDSRCNKFRIAMCEIGSWEELHDQGTGIQSIINTVSAQIINIKDNRHMIIILDGWD